MAWHTGVLEWLETQLKRLVGAGTPTEQIVAGLLLGVLLIATSSIGLVFTLVLLPIPAIAIVIGVLRLVPAIDRAYPV